MAIPRTTCARKSWDSFFASYYDTDNNSYNTTEKARALLDSEGFDESNVNEADNSGITLLMYFCEYYHLTKALLERNADPNLACHKGCTALHYISTSGYDIDNLPYDCWIFDEHESAERIGIADMLIKHGATASLSHRNALGFTPLMYAAHNDRLSLVDYFLSLDFIPRTEKIDALELLGAKQLLYASNYDVHGHEPGFNRLQQAMELRYENPNDPCLKKLTPQHKLYYNYVESRTVEELLMVRNNRRALRAEAYLILQRLIPKEMMIKYDLESHESDYDYSTFNVVEDLDLAEGIDILNFLISLHVESSSPDAEKILNGIQTYLEMVFKRGETGMFSYIVQFGDIQRFLQVVVDIVCQRKEPYSTITCWYGSFQEILDAVALIIYGLACLYYEHDVLEPLIQVLEQLVLWNNQWPVHEKVENAIGAENYSKRTCSVVHALMESAFSHPVLLLIPQNGDIVTRVFRRIVMVDRVNSVNKKLLSDTVLHRAINSWQNCGPDHAEFGLELLLTIIPLLIRHGFSWDQTDYEGRTITGMLSPPSRTANSEALELLKSLKRCDLQELAARVIRNYHIPYRGNIPKHLYNFIEME